MGFIKWKNYEIRKSNILQLKKSLWFTLFRETSCRYGVKVFSVGSVFGLWKYNWDRGHFLMLTPVEIPAENPLGKSKWI